MEQSVIGLPECPRYFAISFHTRCLWAQLMYLLSETSYSSTCRRTHSMSFSSSIGDKPTNLRVTNFFDFFIQARADSKGNRLDTRRASTIPATPVHGTDVTDIDITSSERTPFSSSPDTDWHGRAKSDADRHWRRTNLSYLRTWHAEKHKT